MKLKEIEVGQRLRGSGSVGVTCSRCGKDVTNVQGTLWHTGDPFHLFTDHVPSIEETP